MLSDTRSGLPWPCKIEMWTRTVYIVRDCTEGWEDVFTPLPSSLGVFVCRNNSDQLNWTPSVPWVCVVRNVLLPLTFVSVLASSRPMYHARVIRRVKVGSPPCDIATTTNRSDVPSVDNCIPLGFYASLLLALKTNKTTSRDNVPLFVSHRNYTLFQCRVDSHHVIL